MKNKFVKVLITTMTISSMLMVSANAGTYDLVRDYLENSPNVERIYPQKAGDTYSAGEVYGTEKEWTLMYATGYYEGSRGSHGDKLYEGTAAMSPELYGYTAVVYEAIPTSNGYEPGDQVGIYEIKDTGYGYKTGKGSSDIRPDKGSVGTIETGVHIDVWRKNYSRCVEFMKSLGNSDGMCFVELFEGVRG